MAAHGRFFLHIWGLEADLDRKKRCPPLYCVLNFDHFKKIKTKVVKPQGENKTVSWAEDVTFNYMTKYTDRLKYKSFSIQVYAKGMLSNEFIGATKVDLHTLLTGPISHNLQLWNQVRSAGSVRFKLSMKQNVLLKIFFKNLAIFNLPRLKSGKYPPIFLRVGTTDPKVKSKVETVLRDNTQDAEWFKVEQLRFSTTFDRLFNSDMQLAVICGGFNFGSIKLPFASYARFQDGEEVEFQKRLEVPYKFIRGPAPGPVELRGIFFYNNFPTFAQMTGGVHTDTGIEDAVPAHRMCRKPHVRVKYLSDKPSMRAELMMIPNREEKGKLVESHTKEIKHSSNGHPRVYRSASVADLTHSKERSMQSELMMIPNREEKEKLVESHTKGIKHSSNGHPRVYRAASVADLSHSKERKQHSNAHLRVFRGASVADDPRRTPSPDPESKRRAREEYSSLDNHGSDEVDTKSHLKQLTFPETPPRTPTPPMTAPPKTPPPAHQLHRTRSSSASSTVSGLHRRRSSTHKPPNTDPGRRKSKVRPRERKRSSSMTKAESENTMVHQVRLHRGSVDEIRENIVPWYLQCVNNSARVLTRELRLPVPWTAHIDKTLGRMYFVNHETKSTQWNSPVPLAAIPPTSEVRNLKSPGTVEHVPSASNSDTKSEDSRARSFSGATVIENRLLPGKRSRNTIRKLSQQTIVEDGKDENKNEIRPFTPPSLAFQRVMSLTECRVFKTQVNKMKMKKLLSMGFSHELSHEALLTAGGALRKAISWLMRQPQPLSD